MRRRLPSRTCAAGPALAGSCDTCVTSICAVDPYRCSTWWDSVCIAEGNSHTYKDIPWMLVGGVGGMVSMGRYLQ